jgi:lipoprotein signal peptidase
MEAADKGFSVLSRVLRQNGFHGADEFGAFVTFVREDDLLKIHIGPDESFSAFNIADECIAEGKGLEALYSLLLAKAALPDAADC